MKMKRELNFEISPVSKEYISVLLQFELENKDWFEQFVSARSAHFLTQVGMSEAVTALLDEMKDNTGAYYLAIKNDEVIGRFNFSFDGLNSAELGYRVAKKYAGSGVATFAINQLLPEVKNTLGVDRVKAKTASDNLASNKVLKKCSFEQIGISKNGEKLHGIMIELVRYERKI